MERCAMPCLCLGEHVVTLTDRRREQMGMMKHDTGYASIHVVTFGWYTSYEVIMQMRKETTYTENTTQQHQTRRMAQS